MQGVCVDVGNTSTLEKGRNYYLFEHGPHHFYVSHFEKPGSHFGAFQRKYFTIAAPKRLVGRARDKVLYLAKVVKPQLGYLIGDVYIVGERNELNYYNVYLVKRPNAPIGSYLDNFFEIIEPYTEPMKTPPLTKAARMAEIEPKALNEVKVPTIDTKAAHKAESGGKRRKMTNSNAPDGQMDIFEFL